MSIKPLPGILATETIVSPPPPPVTYERWSSTQINGDYASRTNTKVITQQYPPFEFGVNVLGQYGQSSGKWIAVYTFGLFSAEGGNRLNFVGVSPALPPTLVEESGFGENGYGCVAGFSPSTWRYVNGDFYQHGSFGFGYPPNYIIIASDLTNGRFYIGTSSSPPGHNNPPISNVYWILGDPFAGTGGLTLFTNTVYYPCAGLADPSGIDVNYPFGVTANWGAGALPGYSGNWIPPGYTAWHS